MFLLIDNYDSFTFNLVQAFMLLGRTPVVIKNDDPSLPELAKRPDLSMVCISPGPGHPRSAGFCLDFLYNLPPRVPVLGVCLGHQILGHFAGARVEVGPEVMHGKQSDIQHDAGGMFSGLASPMTVGRYHSLLVRAEDAPETLLVTARTAAGEVMAMRFADRPWAGVQFHPESVLTPEGLRLLANFPSALLVEQDAAFHAAAGAATNAPRTVAAANGTAAGAYSAQAGTGNTGIAGATAGTGNTGATGIAGTAMNGTGLRSTPRPRTPLQMSGIIEKLALRRDLSVEEAAEAFARLMDGELTPSQAGAFLLGLRAKGETPDEVREAVNAVLARAIPVPPVAGSCIDIVGTGGDGKGSFNCSTATALTLAGMGHKVLKHGNRSVSSRCGSADVLEQLGIPLDTPPESVAVNLERDGFVFLFAPRYHPSFRHVMPVRRELGVRTLFNILGPLVNPARPTHHLFGVPNTEQLPLVAATLARSGTGTGAVVCGAGGYDELTALGEASLIFVDKTETREGRLDPAEYGFAPCSEQDLAVEGPEQAAQVLCRILQGQGPKPMQDMLALNLGLALYLLGSEHNAGETVDQACGYNRPRMAGAMEEAKAAVAAGAGRRFCHA